MHILLTDALTCPRCGPRFGLIVLADRIQDRRVLEGRLGCANCREEYTITAGVADLRFPPGVEALAPAGSAPSGDAAYRVAALLGVADRPGIVLLMGLSAALASEVARLLPGATVAATPAAGSPEAVATEGVDWLRVGTTLPFRDRSLRGVAVSGEPDEPQLREAVRVLAPGAHLVLDPAPAGAAQSLVEQGLTLLLEQEGVVVASPSPPR